MSVTLKRGENGELLAKAHKDGLIHIRSSKKIIGDFTMNVKFFINPATSSAYWVLDGLYTTQLGETAKVGEGQIYNRGAVNRRVAVKCIYRRPILLMLGDWNETQYPQLLDENMEFLCGSNIYGESSSDVRNNELCLGVVGNYLDINMIELLIYGKANADLSWRGGTITGKSRMMSTAEKKKTKVFEIDKWPTLSKSLAVIPLEIRDCVDAFKK
tara:strand:+ start:2811 stop:3452 length:642 start_codon:yes stop_codon:yes gene_type:complete